ncbi:phosphoadenosine phosphosulfate reductase [Colletotrichum tofieldiae]|nr:phosphoadenosine phosphosulfate reductase [Colletotrichum tofieldiae]
MIHGNGEHAAAAANSYPAKPHSSEPSPRSFYDVCDELRLRVDAFLAEDQNTEVLRNVQAQLRVSMGVVEEALARYRCVCLLVSPYLECRWIADAPQQLGTDLAFV